MRPLFDKYKEEIGVMKVEFIPNVLRRFGLNPTASELAEGTKLCGISGP
jgi:hypothetical protein